MELMDKAAVVAEIERRLDDYKDEYKRSGDIYASVLIKEVENILSSINTLEVKEIVAEQEGIYNNHFNRIIGDNWNLIIPIENAGLKNGDKVKTFIAKEE